MTTRTFEVAHDGTHYPTDEQSKAALREVLKSEGLKLSGDVEFSVVENTSGGPSKVRATFESEPVKAEPKKAAATPKKGDDGKTDKTMTYGG